MLDVKFNLELTEIQDHFSITITDGKELTDWEMVISWHEVGGMILLTEILSNDRNRINRTEFLLEYRVAVTHLANILAKHYNHYIRASMITVDDLDMHSKYRLEVSVIENSVVNYYLLPLWIPKRCGFIYTFFCGILFDDQATELLNSHVLGGLR